MHQSRQARINYHAIQAKSDTTMQTLNWRDAYAIDGKQGNPWVTIPTRAMILGLDVRKVVTWKIGNNNVTLEVIYDRDYAVEWGREKLKFVSHIPDKEAQEYLADVMSAFADKPDDTPTLTKTTKYARKT